MKRYKVQWAFSLQVSEPVVHTVEAAARGEVAYLLGSWIVKSLEQNIKLRESSSLMKHYPEMEEGIRFLIPEIKRLMGLDMVWEAYDLWEDFYLRFENETGNPLYMNLGTVIVEGSPDTGLKNRIPLLDPKSPPPIEKMKGTHLLVNPHMDLINRTIREVIKVAANKAALKDIKITEEQLDKAIYTTMEVVMNKYPYTDDESEANLVAELREGILRRLFPKPSGLGLGAFNRWLVQYADIVGARHEGRHTQEEIAKADAAEYLKILMHHLGVHADSQERVGRNKKYVKEANEMIQHIYWLLDNNLVWTAYVDFKGFEEKWDQKFEGFPLHLCIGTMRVVPTPEAEIYNG